MSEKTTEEIETEEQLLRYWFAGMALNGWAAGRNKGMDRCRPEEVARSCFAYADAMLEESLKIRNQPN